MSRRPRPVDDSGASLLITLAFVTFVGLIAGAMLAFGGTSVTGAASSKYRGDVVYDVDGALQTAVNTLRNTNYNGDGTTCNEALTGSSATNAALSFAGQNAGDTVKVRCETGKKTGEEGGQVPFASANMPRYALLTMATNPEQGVEAHPSGTGTPFRIRGAVYANSAVSTNPGSIRVEQGDVTVEGSCSGTITLDAGETKTCSAPNGSDGTDPKYPIPSPSSLVPAVLPTSCPSNNQAMVFSPGYYDDATALENAINNCNTSNVYWFRPGTYFFDFRNDDSAGDFLSGNAVWALSSGKRVIAGTPKGWSPTNLAAGQPPAEQACVRPEDSKANGGAAFVFGGSSRMTLNKAELQICGPWSADSPSIVFYGAKSGADSSAQTVLLKAGTDGTDTTGDLAFAPKDQITEIDSTPTTTGKAALAQLGTTGKKTASIAVNLPVTGVAKGSLLSAAKLVVVHRDNEATDHDELDSLAVSVRPNPTSGGTALTGTIPDPTTYSDPASGGAFHTDELALTGAALNDLAKQAHDGGLSSVQVTYTATARNGDRVDSYLDALQLELTWKAPAFRAQSSEVTSPAGSPLVLTEQDGVAVLFHGTVYTPRNKLDLDVKNHSDQLARYGMVVRSLTIKVNPDEPIEPIVALPAETPAVDIYFRAYSCPAGSCTGAESAWGSPKGTARVSYVDPVLGSPAADDRAVVVRSWTTRTRD